MGPWADMGNQCEGGRMEECEPNSLEDPHGQKRPERRSDQIGKGSYGIKEGPDDQKLFLGGS